MPQGIGYGNNFASMKGFGYQDPMASFGQVAPNFSFLDQPPQFDMPQNYDVMKQFGMGVPNFSQPVATGQSSGGMFSGLGKSLKDSGFLGSTDMNTGIKTDGFGGLALGAGQGLLSAFMGMKQYGLGKETLAQNKKVFDMNYNAQRQTTNASLEDRQRARLDRNPNNESVESYMKKNGIA